MLRLTIRGGGERVFVAAAGLALLAQGSEASGVSATGADRGSHTIWFEDALSVGSFLHQRQGVLSNAHVLADVGTGRTVTGVSWDLSITRIDHISRFSDVGVGLLDLNSLPFVVLPFDAPSFGLGGTDDRYDDSGLPVMTQRVRGHTDLTRFWLDSAGDFVDLSFGSDARGLVYVEVFELFDDDDDYGVTASDTALHPDSRVSGSVTLHLRVPGPGSGVALLGGIACGGRRRAR